MHFVFLIFKGMHWFTSRNVGRGRGNAIFECLWNVCVHECSLVIMTPHIGVFNVYPIRHVSLSHALGLGLRSRSDRVAVN